MSGFLLVLTLVAAGCADAEQGTEPGGPAEAVSASNGVGSVLADLDPAGPGCAVAADGPDGMDVGTAGLADVAAGEPIDESTVFDIGSVSKQITAGAVALLVVRGELGLDDDITVHLPELGPFDQAVAVDDLLHHTSGLPDYTELLDRTLEEVTTVDDALAVVDSEDGAPLVPPGEQFEYSNTNYLLLAELVGRVSGEAFPDFVADEIFAPLAMTTAVVRDDQGTLLDDQAVGYQEAESGDWEIVGSAWRQTGDGAVHATAVDLLAWAELFTTDDAAVGDLGSDAWLEVMLQPGPVADGDGGYGGGLELTVGPDGGERVGHGGSWIGYGAALLMAPEEGVAVVLACNIDGVDAEDRAGELLGLWTSTE